MRNPLLAALSLAGVFGVMAAPAFAQSAAPSSPQETPDPRIAASAEVLQRSIDAWRARNFEGWIACYAADVVVIAPNMHINGRAELRAIYRAVFDAGVPEPTILESGWTGDRIFVRQREYLTVGGPGMVSYAEYEIKDGRITSVIAQSE